MSNRTSDKSKNKNQNTLETHCSSTNKVMKRAIQPHKWIDDRNDEKKKHRALFVESP